MKNLLIVESPAKASTIEKYLGKDFHVMSSYGHIRDLPKKGLSIDKDKDFEPTYEIPEDKKKVASALKAAASKARAVWLASDEDREGEAIAWHLCYALGISRDKAKRIVFHEITKQAINQAIESPRKVDKKLVDAQQARRVLDRLVGYELSPVLWKKVKTGLSAGRVQSVAVRLIVEREREISKHEAKSTFKVSADFQHKNGKLKAELEKNAPDIKSAEQLINKIKGANFRIAAIREKDGLRNPSPPFTTSSLQQEAHTRLGFSVRQTMTLAQRLYESGQITYMRTDSVTLSNFALGNAEKYIVKNLGKEYHSKRIYKTKSLGAQEAHEAIRPTEFAKEKAGRDPQQEKLYRLIWRRAIASQMSPAKIKRTEFDILPDSKAAKFIARGEILTFDGYQKIYGQSKDDIVLPNASEGDELKLLGLLAAETFSRPPARYSEAALVKKLEELGIGRPSTYAPTISTIQTRGYVEKRDSEGKKRALRTIVFDGKKLEKIDKEENTGVEKNKLLPTYLAEMTTDFLLKYFAPIVDYEFTAKAEKDFDEIALGKQSWQHMIKDFYKDFVPLLKGSDNASRQETSKARKLGKDPTSGKPIIARYGKYGPMLQKGDVEDEEKPVFAHMPENATIETVTLSQALEAFKLPREVGETEDGQKIIANVGRFGPYVQIDKTFVSIKPKNPMTITKKDALMLYEQKIKQDKDKYIQKFDGGINVVNGPFGPYITDGKTNAKVPKDIDPKKLDEAKAKEILANNPSRRRRKTK